MTDRLSFLSRPLPRDSGMPLRVEVHTRILDGIRTGVLTPGSMIPTEAELGRLLGVSRTVVREALMLLDEDGFVVSRRGIGRFVADALPRPGMERLRPIEELLARPGGKVEARRVEARLQPTSSTFVAEGLGIAPDDPTWFFETVLLRDGEPICLTDEFFAGDAAEFAAAPRSLLAQLLDRHGPALGPGVASLTAGPLGESRATPLGATPDEPALIVSQTAQLRGRPYYLAKHVLRPGAGQLTVVQS